MLVSPQRTQRPWQGRNETPAARRAARYDPACYLCPGNKRVGGAREPALHGHVRVRQRLPGADAPPTPASRPRSHDGPLLRSEGVSGVCRVVCFSPRHDLTLAELPPAEIAAVIDTFAAETAALGRRYAWVQAFENKGEMMGCSNPHPHGQIWASDALPNEVAAEDQHQRAYAAANGTPLLADYARHERERRVRVVHQTDGLVGGRSVLGGLAVRDVDPAAHAVRAPARCHAEARAELAALLSSLLRAYDKLFEVSFPYSMGWHGAPFDAGVREHWQLHAHIYPPLLRSATVKKFMVGYELLAEPQRDLTPEAAAERLRELIR